MSTGYPELDNVLFILGLIQGVWIVVLLLIAGTGFSIAVFGELRRRRGIGRFHGARCRELVRARYEVDGDGTRYGVRGECHARLRATGGDDHTIDYVCEAGHAYRAEHYPVREGYLVRLAASDRPGAPRPYTPEDDSAGGPATDGRSTGRVARSHPEGATHSSRPPDAVTLEELVP